MLHQSDKKTTSADPHAPRLVSKKPNYSRKTFTSSKNGVYGEGKEGGEKNTFLFSITTDMLTI